MLVDIRAFCIQIHWYLFEECLKLEIFDLWGKMASLLINSHFSYMFWQNWFISNTWPSIYCTWLVLLILKLFIRKKCNRILSCIVYLLPQKHTRSKFWCSSVVVHYLEQILDLLIVFSFPYLKTEYGLKKYIDDFYKMQLTFKL